MKCVKLFLGYSAGSYTCMEGFQKQGIKIGCSGNEWTKTEKKFIDGVPLINAVSVKVRKKRRNVRMKVWGLPKFRIRIPTPDVQHLFFSANSAFSVVKLGNLFNCEFPKGTSTRGENVYGSYK